MKIDLFKEVMPSLMHHKNNVFVNADDCDKYYEKSGFIINRVLSMYNDCALQANYMNMLNHLDGKLKNDFYINILRGYKRPYHYVKATKYEDIEIIAQYYNISKRKARDYESLLSRDQIEIIRKCFEKGGII